MTFKLPTLPSIRANMHELADFAELLSWEQGLVSEREIVAYMGRAGDNTTDAGGCDDEEDESLSVIDEVMIEIERRSGACSNGYYPFELVRRGSVIRYRSECEEETGSIIYRYLLMSTRLNMASNKTHAGIDGTLLLERLSAHSIRSYLGARAKSIVFGTAESGSFVDKVNELCKALNEGVNFESHDGLVRPQANDDKLDVVAWVPFTHASPGQIVVFAQCKTGTNWKEYVSQLQPVEFTKKWFRKPMIVDPVRAFCIAESPDPTQWNTTCIGTGILFDRCRIVDCCDGFDVSDIREWTDAAKDSVQISTLKRKPAKKKKAVKKKK